MKQKNKFIKERLKHKQEQLSMQAIRQERLNRTMQNTKDDIDQLIYACLLYTSDAADEL